jgi:diguanylate cyclase (GGDEF)-like protein
MGLDVKTLYLINVAVLTLSSIATWYFWFQYRDNLWLLRWSLATAISAVALLALGIFGPVPPVFIGAPAAVALVAGYALAWESMRLLNGRSAASLRVVWLIVVFAATFGVAVWRGASFSERAALTSAGLAVFAALSAWELWRGRIDDLGRSRHALASLFAVMAALLTARSGLTWLSAAATPATDYYDPLRGLVPLVNSIAVVCLSIGLMIIANERMSGRHRKLALTDELTGLPNRRFFLEQAERLSHRAGRDRVSACIMMMDLDHFSQVNERFGHAGGDAALVAVARLLRGHMRPTDIVARYGGEEFCALVDKSDLKMARQIAEKLRATVAAQPVDVRGKPYSITISIGIAELGGKELAAALRQADEALYLAKARGRNQVVAGSPPPQAPFGVAAG